LSFATDLKILYHMLLRPAQGKTHQERLESFYSGQASGYDEFRKRLLKGREELYRRLAKASPSVWVDMGGGTGANLESIGPAINSIKQLFLVDLSTSLLEVASARAEARGWKNFQPVEADVTTWHPPGGLGSVDVVTFSYSLTMIPDWFAAIDQAERLLKPGGLIGVVDFYVSRKFPAEGRRRHGWFTRTFWPNWFAYDNVFPSADHVPYLHAKFEKVAFSERIGSIPYVPFSRVPHYLFVGRKKG
jgi:S-adenosylmethionine-diacylgycerolhomoserine-N-methlytransferase